MKWIRPIFENAGGRKFLHAGYVVTLLLLTYAILRCFGHLDATHWEPTVGAVWKIAGAFLAAHAIDEATGHLAKRKNGGKP
jgi:hypothetical protein